MKYENEARNAYDAQFKNRFERLRAPKWQDVSEKMRLAWVEHVTPEAEPEAEPIESAPETVAEPKAEPVESAPETVAEPEAEPEAASVESAPETVAEPEAASVEPFDTERNGFANFA